MKKAWFSIAYKFQNLPGQHSTQKLRNREYCGDKTSGLIAIIKVLKYL